MTLAENPAGGPLDDNDHPSWSEWDSNMYLMGDYP